jgi:hypothetical protein
MNTTTLTLNESWLSRRNLFDWVFAALVLAGGLFAFTRYAGSMDYYEKPILAAALIAMICAWLTDRLVLPDILGLTTSPSIKRPRHRRSRCRSRS